MQWHPPVFYSELSSLTADNSKYIIYNTITTGQPYWNDWVSITLVCADCLTWSTADTSVVSQINNIIWCGQISAGAKNGFWLFKSFESLRVFVFREWEATDSLNSQNTHARWISGSVSCINRSTVAPDVEASPAMHAKDTAGASLQHLPCLSVLMLSLT